MCGATNVRSEFEAESCDTEFTSKVSQKLFKLDEYISIRFVVVVVVVVVVVSVCFRVKIAYSVFHLVDLSYFNFSVKYGGRFIFSIY